MRFVIAALAVAFLAAQAPAQCGSALAFRLQAKRAAVFVAPPPATVIYTAPAPTVRLVPAAPAVQFIPVAPAVVEYSFVPVGTEGVRQAAPAKITDGPTTTGPQKAPQYTPEQLREEVEFLVSSDSPKLFPMDKALEVAKITGKPVLCWMGKHAFADPNIRQLSKALGSTTIQAAMDGDGTQYDEFNPRVKFDSSQYVNGGRTYTISSGQFKFEGPDVAKEQTTAYKIMMWFETKKFPGGTDPLTGKRQD